MTGKPAKIAGEPVKIIGVPTKRVGWAIKIIATPVKIIGEPIQKVGEPMKVIGEPFIEVSWPVQNKARPGFCRAGFVSVWFKYYSLSGNLLSLPLLANLLFHVSTSLIARSRAVSFCLDISRLDL